MVLPENCLPADYSHEISCLICNFWKSGKIGNCRLLQTIGGALWVKDYLQNSNFDLDFLGKWQYLQGILSDWPFAQSYHGLQKYVWVPHTYFIQPNKCPCYSYKLTLSTLLVVYTIVICSWFQSIRWCNYIFNMGPSCWWKTLWILTRWLHQKPADQDPHVFKRILTN